MVNEARPMEPRSGGFGGGGGGGGGGGRREGGGGGGWGGGGMGEIDMSSSDYRETILGEATELAVKQVTEKIVAAKTRLE